MTSRERAKIMAAVGCSEATVRRWERGGRLSELMQAAIDRAAKRLGLEPGAALEGES